MGVGCPLKLARDVRSSCCATVSRLSLTYEAKGRRGLLSCSLSPQVCVSLVLVQLSSSNVTARCPSFALAGEHLIALSRSRGFYSWAHVSCHTQQTNSHRLLRSICFSQNLAKWQQHCALKMFKCLFYPKLCALLPSSLSNIITFFLN